MTNSSRRRPEGQPVQRPATDAKPRGPLHSGWSEQSDPSDWAKACHGARFGEGPVLAILAMLAKMRCAWLRVAALLPTPALRAAARLRQVGTGKQARQRTGKRSEASEITACE